MCLAFLLSGAVAVRVDAPPARHEPSSTPRDVDVDVSVDPRVEGGIVEYFQSLDTNMDGNLTTAEIKAHILRELDHRKSQSITEYTVALEELMEHMDVDEPSPGSPDLGTYTPRVDATEFRDHLVSRMRSPQLVARWVRYGVGLPQYADAFLQHAVTSLDFPLLVRSETDPDSYLRDDLGVTSLFHRNKLIQAMKRQILGWGSVPGAVMEGMCSVVGPRRVRLAWSAPANPTFTTAVVETTDGDESDVWREVAKVGQDQSIGSTTTGVTGVRTWRVTIDDDGNKASIIGTDTHFNDVEADATFESSAAMRRYRVSHWNEAGSNALFVFSGCTPLTTEAMDGTEGSSADKTLPAGVHILRRATSAVVPDSDSWFGGRIYMDVSLWKIGSAYGVSLSAILVVIGILVRAAVMIPEAWKAAVTPRIATDPRHPSEGFGRQDRGRRSALTVVGTTIPPANEGMSLTQTWRRLVSWGSRRGSDQTGAGGESQIHATSPPRGVDELAASPPPTGPSGGTPPERFGQHSRSNSKRVNFTASSDSSSAKDRPEREARGSRSESEPTSFSPEQLPNHGYTYSNQVYERVPSRGTLSRHSSRRRSGTGVYASVGSDRELHSSNSQGRSCHECGDDFSAFAGLKLPGSRHHCAYCQRVLCQKHTAYRDHGVLSICSLDSKCVCVPCFRTLSLHVQAKLFESDKGPRSQRLALVKQLGHYALLEKYRTDVTTNCATITPIALMWRKLGTTIISMNRLKRAGRNRRERKGGDGSGAEGGEVDGNI
jgi:hypothetical protein